MLAVLRRGRIASPDVVPGCQGGTREGPRPNGRREPLGDPRARHAANAVGEVAVGSGGLTFPMDGHRGQQQPHDREKRHECSYAREGCGELRGDGGDQHVK